MRTIRERSRRGMLASFVVLGLAAIAIGFVPPSTPRASAEMHRCAAPSDITALTAPLPRTTERLAGGKGLTIVALGSSSTYGTGATRPEYAYPNRLAALLQARFPDVAIHVLNRGVGGEVGTSTAARIARDVLPERPDLVIWQVGTNDVLHDLGPEEPMKAVRAGIEQMKRAGADVILMDVQYAPTVLAHPRYREMEYALTATAHAADVPIFQRFALMHDWATRGNMKISDMLAPDRLHMTDLSYDCLARQLGASILRDAHARGELQLTRG